MILIEQTFFGERNKIQTAIERLKMYEPSEGYYLAFSGGKDSIVIKKLADMANVKYDAHYNVTTIDPPELIYFMRQHYKGLIKWHFPEEPFLKALVRKGFPQWHRRWCCAIYKESGGYGRLVVTGVRWAESTNRKNRRMVETCYTDHTRRFLHPIIDWEDEDVWLFIKEHNLSYCSLYDEGWKRIGCMFCPVASGKMRKSEIKRYPKIADNFRKAFVKCHELKKAKGLKSADRWNNGEEMFRWWLQDRKKKKNSEQKVIFE